MNNVITATTRIPTSYLVLVHLGYAARIEWWEVTDSEWNVFQRWPVGGGPATCRWLQQHDGHHSPFKESRSHDLE